MMHEHDAWWIPRVLEQGGGLEWTIGPTRVAVFRLPGEWRVTNSENSGAAEDEWTTKEIFTLPQSETLARRYLGDSPSSSVVLVPALADRSVVSRPVTPFSLPRRQETRLFVSSPLWVRVMVGDPSIVLEEFPLQRPSDTWFGPSTREGDLCYASRTQGVLEREDLPFRAHRAVTPVTIRNNAENPLHVERISLPVPNLELFGDPGKGHLWTQAVTLVREEDNQDVTLEIHQGPPPPAGPVKPVAAPRIAPGKGILTRAIGSLFS